MIEHRGIERRRPGQEAHPVTFDPRQHRLGLEGALRQDARTADQRRQPTGLEAEGVEEGVDDQVAVVGVEADDLPPVIEQAHILPVGAEHTLGIAGGARSEDQVAQAVAIQRGAALLQLLLVDFTGADQEAFPIGSAGPRLLQHHALLQLRQIMPLEQRRVVAAEELADAEQQARAAAAQDIGGLGALQTGAQRHQHHTSHQAAEGGDYPALTVGRPYRHPLAGLQTEGQQGTSGFTGALLQLGIGQLQAVVVDGDTFAIAAHGLGQGCGDGLRHAGDDTHD
ncbi:hypothetical protein D3C84_694450 [compost metagenome]